MDMTSIWVAEHGWCYLNAVIDCCTWEITDWSLELRCRADEAIAVVEHAARSQGILAGRLTLGTDNGSAYTARRFKAVLSRLGIANRRGGYRDPESQAFIESWFGKLKERLVWRSEFETLEEAHAEVGAYIDRYHNRPHSGLGYRTPKKVRQTREDAREEDDAYKNQRPEVSTGDGSRSPGRTGNVRIGLPMTTTTADEQGRSDT
jgi:putative transposase